MDLKLKYSEGSIIFETEESFIDELEILGDQYLYDILLQMKDLCQKIPNKKGELQTYGGVSHEGTPLFFELTVLKEKNNKPYFLEIIEISTDEYLDHVLNKQTINQMTSRETNSLWKRTADLYK